MVTRVVLDTNAILDIFEGATTEQISYIRRARRLGIRPQTGRTGRFSRTALENNGVSFRRDFLPSTTGRRFLKASGLTPGSTLRVVVSLPLQVVEEFQRVVQRHYAAAGLPAVEAENFVREALSLLLFDTFGTVDPRSREEAFVTQVEANCREAGRGDRDELFAWNRRDLGRVDEAAILLAVLDRDMNAVLVTADAKASARAFVRGAAAFTINELCEELENSSFAA